MHPETLGEECITRPFNVGLRNSLVALAAIAIGGLGYLIEFSELSESTAWWAWSAVAAGAVIMCFGHAYLGSRIGGRRANGIAVLVLFGFLGGADTLDEARDRHRAVAYPALEQTAAAVYFTCRRASRVRRRGRSTASRYAAEANTHHGRRFGIPRQATACRHYRQQCRGRVPLPRAVPRVDCRR